MSEVIMKPDPSRPVSIRDAVPAVEVFAVYGVEPEVQAYAMYEAVARKYPGLAKYFRVHDVREPVDLLKR